MISGATALVEVVVQLHGQVAGEEANGDGIDRNEQQACNQEQECFQDALLSPIL